MIEAQTIVEKFLIAMFAAWIKNELTKLRGSVGKYANTQSSTREEVEKEFEKALKLSFRRAMNIAQGNYETGIPTELGISFLAAWWSDTTEALKRQVGPFLVAQQVSARDLKGDILQLLAGALDLVCEDAIANAKKLDAQALKKPE